MVTLTIYQMFEGIRNGTPDCDIRFEDDTQCRWPSIVRMQTRCCDCGHRSLSFLCQGHRRGVEAREVRCYHCKAPSVEIKVS